MLSRFSLLLFTLVFLGACSMPPDASYFQTSYKLPPYNQDNFEDYVRDTRAWIADNRAFLSDNHSLEIQLNSPFEVRPNKPAKRGILMVHGLGASPWYFDDIARTMADDGWLVRSILLPGHGTRPADLMLPSYDDWEGIIAHHVNLLAAEVDELWLAGFSTGGNLVTSHALKDENIDGLLLFSPGFYPNSNYLFLAPVISYLWNWVDIDEENNIVNYQSLPARGAALYYRSVSAVQKSLKASRFEKPVLITMSQHDSVLDPTATLKIFHTHFTNTKSRFIWYGETPKFVSDSRVNTLTSYLPERRISTFSHLSVLFSPENFYYGEKGSHILFDNGQENIPIPETTEALWFGAWGQVAADKYHARLTWNPYFFNLLKSIREVVGD